MILGEIVVFPVARSVGTLRGFTSGHAIESPSFDVAILGFIQAFAPNKRELSVVAELT